MSHLLAVFKLFLFAVIVVVITIVQPIVLLFTHGRFSYVFPRIWHWLVCCIFGIKVNVVGDPNQQGQVIYMSNHISYLDIPVLGSVIKGSFVAKEDVEGWALFGFLSRFQQTVFISRRRESAKTVQSDLDLMLSQDKDLIIFPEGTSTDGRDVWPFKSSLFSLVVGSSVQGLKVQPVTIRVSKTDGRDINPQSGQDDIDLYAWHVNMDTELGDHLWRFSKLSGTDLDVIFHEPISAHDAGDRKALAKLCHEKVRGGLLQGCVA